MISIGIDAGHGGEDSGACYPRAPSVPAHDAPAAEVEKYAAALEQWYKTRLAEKDLTLVIARRLNQAINGAGWDAHSFLTRDMDETMKFATRRAMLDKYVADFTLSIHVNAADPAAKGLIAFHLQGDAKSWDIASTIARCCPKELIRSKNSVVAATNLKGPEDDWLKRAWNVLNAYGRPAVLVETGFITHPDDRANLQKAHIQDAIVAACMAGVARLLSY